jgi:hypothetical protein
VCAAGTDRTGGADATADRACWRSDAFPPSEKCGRGLASDVRAERAVLSHVDGTGIVVGMKRTLGEVARALGVRPEFDPSRARPRAAPGRLCSEPSTVETAAPSMPATAASA